MNMWQKPITVEKPSFMDSDEIPFVEEVLPHLLAVFDAFEEICFRLKEENDSSNEEI